ncbi:MAG: DNA methyltransferase [Truepera sp.]|nr:DNA methyltransferase [Truepera sp.]
MSLFNELLSVAVTRTSPRIMARWLDKAHFGNSLELMQKLPVGSVDTIIAKSPPPEDKPYGEYVEEQRKYLRAMMRVLREDGAIFYDHKWQVQDGLIQDPGDILKGFPVRHIVIWHRTVKSRTPSSGPNHEAVYLIAKPDFELDPRTDSSGQPWDDLWIDLDSVEFAQRCIELTTGKIVLDPFMDSDTVRIAAENAGRRWIGFSSP